MAALAAAGSGGEAAGAARLVGDLSDARLIEQQVRGTWDGVGRGEVGWGELRRGGLGWIGVKRAGVGWIEVGGPAPLSSSRTV